MNNDLIVSTEHGPHGGDEINLNLNTKKVKNFDGQFHHMENIMEEKSLGK